MKTAVKLLPPGPARNLDAISDCEAFALRNGCPRCRGAWTELLATQERHCGNRRIVVVCALGHARLFATWGTREPSSVAMGIESKKDTRDEGAIYGNWSAPWSPGSVERVQRRSKRRPRLMSRRYPEAK